MATKPLSPVAMLTADQFDILKNYDLTDEDISLVDINVAFEKYNQTIREDNERLELFKLYNVSNFADLVKAQAKSITALQARLSSCEQTAQYQKPNRHG